MPPSDSTSSPLPAPGPDSESTRPTNWFERLLRLFSDVRGGEGATIALMTLNIFLILASYYIIKTLRESEILSRGMFGLSGAELKAYANAGQAMLLLGVVPLYGLMASKVRRLQLLNISLIIFMACLGIFFVLAGPLELNIGLAYYIWVGIFNVFVIAQFWSFANDIYSKDQGKRLFPIIAVGGSLGAIFGPRIASAAKQYPYELMLASAAVLGVCMLLYNLVNLREHKHGDARARENVEKTLSKDGGFQLVMRERYLLLIAIMLTLANFTNTTGEYLFSNLVEIHAAEEVPDTAFPELAPDEQEKAVRKARGAVVTGIYGSYYGWVNILSLLIQAFVVSRIFKYLGVRAALFFLPVIVLGGYALVLIAPIFGVLRVAKLAENSTDYSLQNTVRQALFLPTSREAKYKAKAAIDTFFFRFGDTAAAFLIFAGIHWLHFSTSQYAAVCLAAALGGLVTVTLLAREHKKLVPDDKRTDVA